MHARECKRLSLHTEYVRRIEMSTKFAEGHMLTKPRRETEKLIIHNRAVSCEGVQLDEKQERSHWGRSKLSTHKSLTRRLPMERHLWIHVLNP